MSRLSTYFFLLLLCVFIACGQAAADTETDISSPETEVPAVPNEDNTTISDVDDDPYLISNGEFLGMRPGSPLDDFVGGLRKGTLQTGEGDFPVYYIDGAEGEELGYLVPDPRDGAMIGDIIVTSQDVVTEAGIRVGVNFEELQNRLGRPLEVHGSEIESRTYAVRDGFSYRIGDAHDNYELEASQVDPTAEVLTIELRRQ
ncbi:MAG: hypothetical protein AAFZ52_06040 [Bacteroidota bacterium]